MSYVQKTFGTPEKPATIFLKWVMTWCRTCSNTARELVMLLKYFKKYLLSSYAVVICAENFLVAKIVPNLNKDDLV